RQADRGGDVVGGQLERRAVGGEGVDGEGRRGRRGRQARRLADRDDRGLLLGRDLRLDPLRRDDARPREDLRRAVPLERLERQVEVAVLLERLADEAERQARALEREVARELRL